jgi:hypothetical protein
MRIREAKNIRILRIRIRIRIRDTAHKKKKGTVFLNIINWVSKSLATGTGTSTTFNVTESGSNSPETVLFRD